MSFYDDAIAALEAHKPSGGEFAENMRQAGIETCDLILEMYRCV